MTGWLRAEFARARERMTLVPLWARPVYRTPDEQWDAERCSMCYGDPCFCDDD